MPLSVACTSCGAKIRTPDYAFGRVFKCPKCGTPVTVDSAPNQPKPVEIVEPISPFCEPTPPDDIPVLELAYEEGTKVCPFCAETIRAAAKKCKHCGERIDESPRAAATTEAVVQGAKTKARALPERKNVLR